MIKAAKAEIEERRKKKYEEERDEHDAKVAERAAKEKARDRKLGGKKPIEPTHEPKATDQVNLTDDESRIMPTSGGGFSQAYNTQASVDMDSRIIVHNHVTQNTNDKKELSPSLAQLEALPESIGKVKKAAVDSGYDSQNNKEETEEQKQRRELYNRRKSTIESVFGIIKSVIGFTRFSLRGLEDVSNEWNLVCIAYNLKRLCAQKMKVT